MRLQLDSWQLEWTGVSKRVATAVSAGLHAAIFFPSFTVCVAPKIKGHIYLKMKYQLFASSSMNSANLGQSSEHMLGASSVGSH